MTISYQIYKSSNLMFVSYDQKSDLNEDNSAVIDEVVEQLLKNPELNLLIDVNEPKDVVFDNLVEFSEHFGRRLKSSFSNKVALLSSNLEDNHITGSFMMGYGLNSVACFEKDYEAYDWLDGRTLSDKSSLIGFINE